MASPRRAAARTALSQPARLAVAIGYVLLLLFLGRYLNGRFLPPFGLPGLWFYSAFGVLILGEFIIEPFFTRPADALASSIALVIACASVSLTGAEITHSAAVTGRLVYVISGLLLIVLSVAAITFKDRTDRLGDLATWAASVAGRAGQARWLFSALLFGAGYAAFAHSAGRVAALYLSWFVVFVLTPLESAWLWRLRRRAVRPPKVGGIIESVEDPGIVVARLPTGTKVTLGMRARFEASPVEGVVVDSTSLLDEPRVRIALPAGETAALGAAVELSDPAQGDPIVGFVGEGTTLADLLIDTAPMAAAAGLEEARLVSTTIGDRDVLYQITEALIAGQRAETGPRDVVRVTARKLGIWNEHHTVFENAAWIPTPGSPVRLLVSAAANHFSAPEIGHVPGTQYGVRVDLDLAVTHNTAILGILGVGKTHLAWELVKRMLAHGTKVLVLDITGQYASHLDPVCGPAVEQAIAEDLRFRTIEHLEDRSVRGDQAGNVAEFRAALQQLLTDFVEGEERLLILNPNRFEVSRMDGKPFSGNANSMVRLTMVDVTRMVAEGLLDLVDDTFSDTARICLVLEEAHSLVPEWNSTVNEAERSAVNGTARAILQGRKYGLGCLLVTQRTANVTKSILNQCNTIVGMRIYDATGMGFLENYIGSAHARLLATLPERHAVVFGRASSCNAPIILRLNDASAFNSGFWEQRVAEIPHTHPPEPESPAQPAGTSLDDEIPF